MRRSNDLQINASAVGVFPLGGVAPVARLGYGAMRITGPGVMGEPADAAEARHVLLRAVELGVTFIDTAHAYGPLVSERLIGETLAPYNDDLVIATKGGLHRDSRGAWLADGSPATLRAELEQSLSLLRLETVDLYQLHTVDRDVPVAESIGALAQMQRQGLIKMIGVSNVSLSDLRAAQAEATIVSVQNRFSVGDDERYSRSANEKAWRSSPTSRSVPAQSNANDSWEMSPTASALHRLRSHSPGS